MSRNEFFPGDCVDKQKLLLHEKLNKTHAEDAVLHAEELLLIKKCSCLNEKRWILLLLELQLRKQLGVLGELEKKLFSQELASIKELKKAE